MKPPRWLVISLLSVSVLSVLGAAAWWWVTWPERTAREFAELLEAGKFEEANRMLSAHIPVEYLPSDVIFVRPIRFPVLESRTWTDYLVGRVRFRAGRWLQWLGWETDEGKGSEFVAIRGRVDFGQADRNWINIKPFVSGQWHDVKLQLEPEGKDDSPTTPEASPKKE